jgi:hypothetical protein
MSGTHFVGWVEALRGPPYGFWFDQIWVDKLPARMKIALRQTLCTPVASGICRLKYQSQVESRLETHVEGEVR